MVDHATDFRIETPGLLANWGIGEIIRLSRRSKLGGSFVTYRLDGFQGGDSHEVRMFHA